MDLLIYLIIFGVASLYFLIVGGKVKDEHVKEKKDGK